MEINTEEVKEEVLKVSKWARFFFMFVYSFAISAALNIAIGIAAIQFLFFLFTSKVNAALFDFNKYMFIFIDDTLRFLLFETEEKPFPFKKFDSENNSAPEIIEGETETAEEAVSAEEDVVEEVSEVVESAAEEISEDPSDEKEEKPNS